jgi:hypothetical protein
MEDSTLSWLAALIDGEGSVMLNKRTYSGNTERTTLKAKAPSYRPVVVIACNTDYRLMEAIRGRMQVGQICQHRVGGDPRTPRKRSQWTYRLNVGQIWEWLPSIRPWLVLKGEQSDLLLEAMDIKRKITPGQPGFLPRNRPPFLARLDEIYASIRAANTVGRTIEEVV